MLVCNEQLIRHAPRAGANLRPRGCTMAQRGRLHGGQRRDVPLLIHFYSTSSMHFMRRRGLGYSERANSISRGGGGVLWRLCTGRGIVWVFCEGEIGGVGRCQTSNMWVGKGVMSGASWVAPTTARGNGTGSSGSSCGQGTH